VDGDAVRAQAREVAALADEVRRVVAWARRAADADWESLAAEAFRAQLHAEVDGLPAAAAAVDEAAAALVAHALAVDALASSPVHAVGEVVRRLLP